MNEKDAHDLLDAILQWEINFNKPELGYCPVVLMGHALNNDLNMLTRSLGVKASVFDTVVKTVDTQHLCVDTGHWSSRNQVSLSKLVGICNLQYRDAHTASNDAAMTLICAVQLVLPPELKERNKPEVTGRSLQDVIDDIEIISQEQYWAWGTDKYCIRCGQRGHTRWAPARPAEANKKPRSGCFVKVWCTHCGSSKDEKRLKAARSHDAKVCIQQALPARKARVDVDDIADEFGGMAINYYY